MSSQLQQPAHLIASTSSQSQQHMNAFLFTISEEDLLQTFAAFLELTGISVEKTCRMISYNCYETTFICNKKRANGYGRNENESNVNCIRNLLEFLFEDDRLSLVFKDTLHKLHEGMLLRSGTAIQVGSISINSQAVRQSGNGSSMGMRVQTPTNNNPNNSMTGATTTTSNTPSTLAAQQTNFSRYYNDTLSGQGIKQQMSKSSDATTTSSNSQLAAQNIPQQQTSWGEYSSSSSKQSQTTLLQQQQQQQLNNNQSSHMQQVQPQNVTTSQQNFYIQQGSGKVQQQNQQQPPSMLMHAQSVNTSIDSSNTILKNNPLRHSYDDQNSATSAAIRSNTISTTNSSQNNTHHQHRHQRTKSVTANPLQSSSTSMSNSNIPSNCSAATTVSQQKSSATIDASMIPSHNSNTLPSRPASDKPDQRTSTHALEEELKKARNYIEHLERKIHLVLEENKILKQLVVENKKGGRSETRITSNRSSQGVHQTTAPQPTSTLSTVPNENIPPSQQSGTAALTATKQPYFFPPSSVSAMSSTSIADKNTRVNRSNTISIPNQNQSQLQDQQQQQQQYFTIQHSLTSSQFREAVTASAGGSLPQSHLQKSSQHIPLSVAAAVVEVHSNILKDASNKANIIQGTSNNATTTTATLKGVQQVTETLKMKPNPNTLSTISPAGDENAFKSNNEKFRSMSVDVCGKRNGHLKEESTHNRMEQSCEPGSGAAGRNLLGHKRYQNRIPKLNLQILPNYHGKSNQSINQQLLVNYQSAQQQQQQQQSQSKSKQEKTSKV